MCLLQSELVLGRGRKRGKGKDTFPIRLSMSPTDPVRDSARNCAGQFPVEACIRFFCGLSPDGRYLASSALEVEQSPQEKVRKSELVVWQRDADKPACRWPLPVLVLWADFIGPDRLALYHTTPSPKFVILDVTKGAPVVTAPLPADEFSAEHDHLSPRTDLPYYRVQTTSGAVSPGRKLIALGGRTSIVLLGTDGQVGGKLPVEQVLARVEHAQAERQPSTRLRFGLVLARLRRIDRSVCVIAVELV